MTYPSGFKIKSEYNTNGYLTAIKNDVNSQLIWQCNEMNKYGKVTKAQYGNGIINNSTYSSLGYLETDNQSKGATTLINHVYGFEETTGDLITRQDVKRNLYEVFQYDDLDRLTNINNTLPINYAPNGNINSKADVGSYNYAPPIGMPHAVKNITSPQNISALQQDILYTTFNKVQQISEGNRRYNFSYNADQQRNKVQMFELTNAGANQTLLNTRYYSGATELDVNATSNATRQLEYINSPNGLVALHVVNSTATQDSMYYIGTDHLGSITLITNNLGNVVQERSYDAWGRLRNPNDWNFTNVQPLVVTDRGYTVHEHLQAFKLINMNGRVYDPIVGRMLSPDVLVQAPNFTQSYNRYTYCWNNPLKYIDPTGYVLAGGSGSAMLDEDLYYQSLIDERNAQNAEFIANLGSGGEEYSNTDSQDAQTATVNDATGEEDPPQKVNSDNGLRAIDFVPLAGSVNAYLEDYNNGDYLGASTNLAMFAFELFTLGAATEYAIGSRVAKAAAKTGTTVLGHYPAYTKLAGELGAKRFNIPTNVWNKMTPAQQWAANQKFLDRMILAGDNIRLATPLNQVKPGSFYQKELNYLFDKGYKVSSDGLWLVK